MYQSVFVIAEERSECVIATEVRRIISFLNMSPCFKQGSAGHVHSFIILSVFTNLLLNRGLLMEISDKPAF